jgi:hypothetical protein
VHEISFLSSRSLLVGISLRSGMAKLYKFLTLSPTERHLVVRAAFLLAFIRLSMGLVPFRTIRRLVVGPRRTVSGRGNRQLYDEVVWAVTAASQRLPRWATTCLSSALTVQAMLARLGYPSRLHVGVMRGARGQLAAHAWVEHEGRIVIGGSAADLRRFSPLTAFDVEEGESRASERMHGGR